VLLHFCQPTVLGSDKNREARKSETKIGFKALSFSFLLSFSLFLFLTLFFSLSRVEEEAKDSSSC
jgi:hypothetical protein